MGPSVLGQQEDATSTVALKKLSVEELMNMEVTSVSRRKEKLSETASAIQVITSEDIQRYGATRLPEVLRLATNLAVNQIDAAQWAISARGFTSTTANKLLVMIDGRTVYSPLFAGMFWDIQDVLLEDIDRIEVISGPGGTQWGANAVNGVINIITKMAKHTKGLYAEAGAGNELRAFGGLRYGVALAPNLNFRIYGKYSDRDESALSDGTGANNEWNQGQGGFRMGWEASENDLVTVQGDWYRSEMAVSNPPGTLTLTHGGNLLARWSHTVSENSDYKIQVYYDRVHRGTTGSFNDILNTYDIDYQHRLLVDSRNDLVWGAGYRLVDDNFIAGTVSIVPQHLSLPLFNVFIQDEIGLVKEKLSLTIGTKALHNYYTGFEFQPSMRLAWRLDNHQQFVWAAISRAVRTPSRIDRDFILPPVLNGGPNFMSEELLAYELGYRIRPHDKVSVSLATYFNDYNKIRSIEPEIPPAPTPVVIANGQRGETYGAELTIDYEIAEWWRLRAGYTTIHVDIRAKPGSFDTSEGSGESADPKHYLALRSTFDLSKDIKLYPSFRYVSELEPRMKVPAYAELDLRLAWQISPKFELSVTGQNLLHHRHAEFGNANNRKEIERNVYGKILWRY